MSASESEEDWEAVDVPTNAAQPAQASAPQEDIEITLDRPAAATRPAKRARRTRGPSHADRQLRIEAHKIHVITLLAVVKCRNSMLNDPVLQARLMSKIPLRIQNAFQSYSPRTHPNERDRSRLFDAALRDLVHWWCLSFDIDSSLGIRHQSWYDVENEIQDYRQVHPLDPKGKAIATSDSNDEQEQINLGAPTFRRGEPIKSIQSLMKRAVLMNGSSDTSAQLFTSLCRTLDIPARLVFSLQPLNWKTSADKPSAVDASSAGASAGGTPISESKSKTIPKSKRVGKKPVENYDPPSDSSDDYADDADNEEFEEVEIASVSNQKPSRPQSNVAQSSRSSSPSVVVMENNTPTTSRTPMPTSATDTKRRKGPPVKLRSTAKFKTSETKADDSAINLNQPPVFWTEVFCRASKQWISVDPIRDKIRCQLVMEPPKSSKTNQLVYVVAAEEDDYIRDVTPRYAKHMGGETMKLRPTARSKTGTDFWEEALKPFIRPFKLARDEKEDAELLSAQYREQLPSSVSGFKNHPLYALERHLKRDEVLRPKKQVATFRGEAVYPRTSVITLKSSETYMREGRQIRQGEQPLKMVKQRAVTINKRRAQELAIQEGREEVMQGLYAEWQTELVVPEPVINGKVPRNAYGNLDLFAPHMLPAGGAFIPYKGASKIAKKLGVDYAEAVTGFEFKQRRAVPSISGIIVPEGSRESVFEGYIEWEQKEIEKQLQKDQNKCLAKWRKLIKGLQIRERLYSSYQDLESKEQVKNTDQEVPIKFIGDKRSRRENVLPERQMLRTEDNNDMAIDSPGGFISEGTADSNTDDTSLKKVVETRKGQEISNDAYIPSLSEMGTGFDEQSHLPVGETSVNGSSESKTEKRKQNTSETISHKGGKEKSEPASVSDGKSAKFSNRRPQRQAARKTSVDGSRRSSSRRLQNSIKANYSEPSSDIN